MYVSDGVGLTESEFKLLRDLADAERGGAFKSYVDADLWHNVPIHLSPDENRGPVYASLIEKGLVSGQVHSGIPYPTRLTYLGRDWVPDYYRAVERDRKKTLAERVHDYRVAIIGSASGVVVGALVEAVTGIMSALLGLR